MDKSLHGKKKQLKAVNSEHAMDIDEMIHLASRKLYPIIERLVDNSKNSQHFLTTQEFDDAIIAANIIKEIYKILVHSNFKINSRNVDFSLEKYKDTMNDQGKIYVKTGLLLQLIDLYNILEDTKDAINEIYSSSGINSFAQTESRFSVCSEESLNPNKIVLRLTKPLTKSSSSFGLLSKSFIVMPSTTDEGNDEDNNNVRAIPLRESKSNISTGSGKIVVTKRIKSAGSLANEEISEVTDVYGAKRVVIRCICDLQEVSKFLGSERKDVGTVYSKNEDDGLVRRKSNKSIKSTESRDSDKKGSETNRNIEPLHQKEGSCCCPDCFAEFGSRANLQECDDDKIVICIKGCNENEGDVQIVIRQCPECKVAEDAPPTRLDKTSSEVALRNKNKPESSVRMLTERKTNKEEYTITDKESAGELTSLHNKESQRSYVYSDEENYEKLRNVPSLRSSSHSIKEVDSSKQNVRRSLQKIPATGQEKGPAIKQQQSQAEYSKIRMFETTNLCLETDTGQELVISVTVTPREFDNKKLSLRDIFSDDDYQEGRSNVPPEDGIKSKKRSSIDSGSRKSVSLSEHATSIAYVEDRVIPLERTKLCSSVDFDVTTLQTRIRDKGIRHKNAKIVVQLRELGIDNLLRACRPAKCCRKSVLNEKMKKCLPYAPSLRSLPLDEGDMEVINQSLQMSLQKVKNSTNLKKDFYANYRCSIKPVQTIMYFIVEQNNNILSLISKTDTVRQKLSYYINLVNDIGFESNSTFNILYFGIKETSNINVSDVVKTSPDITNRNINNKHSFNLKKQDVTWDPSKCGTKKYNKYEKRPMLMGYTNIGQNNSFLTNANLELTRSQCNKESNQKKIHNQSEISNPSVLRSKTKTLVSRIPRYKGNSKAKNFNAENINYSNIEQVEQEVYGISLDSLPKEFDLVKDNNLSSRLESKSNLSSKNESNDKKQSYNKNITQQIGQVSSIFKSPETSRYSVLSNYVVRKTKRKKKSFYLSRSKSDISIKTLNDKRKQRATCTQTKYFVNEIIYKKPSRQDTSKKISSTNIVIKKQDSSTIVLNYFTKMLYNMIIRETLKEKALESMVGSKTQHVDYSGMTENKSLYELYKRFSNRSGGLNNLEIQRVNVKSSHHDLKAKKSESHIFISSKTSKTDICVIENLAVQTSVLFGDSKQCQTSNSLLTYVIKPKIQYDGIDLPKRRLFKNIYHNGALSGIRNSCDQLEKYIVFFKSDHSIISNLSSNTDCLVSASEHSGRSYENVPEQTISNSLLMLKETLEKYETVKNEITQGSLRTSNINPIEYFVYQMCACNKGNKEPSVMQKLLNKSKGLFSSTEKDICNKYNNQRKFLDMPSADKQLCHACGCLISKCGDNIPSEKEFSVLPASCQCSPDNKLNKPPSEPCCKRHKNHGSISNLQKITNASISSVRSLKTYFKKSLSNIKVRSKDKGLSPCHGDKHNMARTKNVETICIPKGVRAKVCAKKDTSTGTTKDSTTQNCECRKCDNFSEDGTCCCSHCLGCLDKSFDAKLDNNNIGTLCKCSEELLLHDSSKDNGDVTNVKKSATIDRVQSLDNKKDVKSVSNNTEPNQEVKNSNNTQATVKTDSSQLENALPTSDKTDNENSNAVTAQSYPDNQQNEEVINIEQNIRENANHDTTSYYVLTSPPNMFNQFGLEPRNPFEQYLINFPHIGMFRLDTSQTFLNE